MAADDSIALTRKERLAAYQKAWREAHKETRKAYAREYYQKNRDAMQEQNRRHYRENAETYKTRSRKWERENVERKRKLRAGYRAKYRERIKEFGKRDWRRHGDKRRQRKAEYRRERPDLAAHHCRLRQTRKQRATPAWADLAAIKAIYREAARVTKETGIKHHVDHEVPLTHPLVCGLHVHTNLRVIPAAVNQAKGNSLIKLIE